MSPLSGGNFKMAIHALKAARWRSIFTMLGIIIGVVAVVTIISIGEGIRRQIAGQINQFGSDLITIRPGKLVDRGPKGEITGVNVLASLNPGSLSEADLQVIQKSPNVKVAVPLSLVSGTVTAGGHSSGSINILGTSENLPEVLNQKIAFGSFFSSSDTDKPVVVIGRTVADQLFMENAPIGRALSIRGQDFVVSGIFDSFATSSLVPGSDFNSTVFVSYTQAKRLSGGTATIAQVLVKPQAPATAVSVTAAINARLLAAHGGQQDFTVLTQDENLAVDTRLLTLVAGSIAAIAAISLIVAGIGIMNIMFVSVTERTREIGLRKAIGATNRQILTQFLIEAVVLSVVGGVLGVALSIAANFVLRIFTSLQPVVTLPMVLVACGVSLAVGIIFGITPALHAARKNPIEALRFE